MKFLWISYALFGCCLASDLSPYCRLKLPYTGYRFLISLFHGINYLLVYCKDNKLIFKSTIDSLNNNFTFGNNNFTIMKSRSTILPNKLLGSLLVNNEFVTPMLSENLLKSWIEVNHQFEKIIHIPILSSPQIDSKYYIG